MFIRSMLLPLHASALNGHLQAEYTVTAGSYCTYNGSVVLCALALLGSICNIFLSEEHRLRVFENKVLRRIFGPKRDEVTGDWRKLHNEELSDLYSSPSIIRIIKSKRMRWAGHVAGMGEKRDAYRLLVGKPRERDH
jgi:hypothetical protein